MEVQSGAEEPRDSRIARMPKPAEPGAGESNIAAPAPLELSVRPRSLRPASRMASAARPAPLPQATEVDETPHPNTNHGPAAVPGPAEATDPGGTGADPAPPVARRVSIRRRLPASSTNDSAPPPTPEATNPPAQPLPQPNQGVSISPFGDDDPPPKRSWLPRIFRFWRADAQG
jgi:hypothetical protein